MKDAEKTLNRTTASNGRQAVQKTSGRLPGSSIHPILLAVTQGEARANGKA
jgi:hypothetical protein